MYKVYFIPRGVFGQKTEDECERFPLAKFDDHLQACQFAFALHQSSNLHHLVIVEDSEGNRLVQLFKASE